MSEYRVHAIATERLESIRSDGDDLGNPIVPSTAEGWEPLRCCLKIASAGERIAVISYSPFTVSSPWSETGPVFIHADSCAGYPDSSELPAAQRTGAKILRTYRDDESLNYDHITMVPEDVDIEDTITKILDQPDVAAVHVRAVMAQCFAYAVTAESDR